MFTLGGQQMPVKAMEIPFMCIPSRNKTWIAATSFASQKYSALMQLVMVRWCGVLGNEQCWVVLWTPPMKTLAVLHHMHSLSTVATYFTRAVKSDDVHLIMVRREVRMHLTMFILSW